MTSKRFKSALRALCVIFLTVLEAAAIYQIIRHFS
jgi:hypothetical protein